MEKRVIIGITGTLGAGKGTIAEILTKKGFEHHSVRKYLENRLEKETESNNFRGGLVDLANKLRAENSPSFLAEELYKEAQSHQHNATIESIRTPGEIEALSRLGDFYLVAVDAPSEIRYERIKNRKSSTDLVTYEEFMEQEKKEMSSNDPNKQNISACISRADYIIQNQDNLKELTDKILNDRYGLFPLITKGRRPTFNEQFMMGAYNWANMSTCLRRHVGANLTKNNKELSQGYNGPPRGAPHCEELGGCLREKLKIPSGQRDEICRAVHAEPNAILNCETEESRIGTTLYVTNQPCYMCAKLIGNSGIKEVIYLGDYPSEMTEQALKDSNVKLTKYSGATPKGYKKFWDPWTNN